MILAWGVPGDGPLAAVLAALEREGAPFVLVDQRDVLGAELELGSTGRHTAGGRLRTGGRTVDMGAVSAAYLRPYDTRRLPRVARAGPGSREWRHATGFDERLWSWAELTPALVVNRGSAMAANGSKPFQAERIRAAGFHTPDTLVTTDPEAVHAFREAHEAVVYKSVSGVRSVVTRLRSDDLARLDRIACCPTQFQAWIPGDDHRVHVVGRELFCCRIESDADDYRYAASVHKAPAELPAPWDERCRALAAREGLTVAGIDLRRTPDGEWHCFEVNPSPAFTYYDPPGEPIAAAVARLLRRAAEA